MKPCILVVDDDREIFDLLLLLLEPEGFAVHWAADGEEFGQKAFSNSPCLILLDIALGDENGPDVYRRLLARGLDRRIPVIFISGLIPHPPHPQPVEPGRMFALHAKPFQFDRLLTDIRLLISPN